MRLRWKSSADGPGDARPPLWGLIADTHFKEQGLNAIEQATAWATNTFKERGVNRVFVLGDMLNTREMVHVGAQSAAMTWVHGLVEQFGISTQGTDGTDSGVHVLLGNHDMHLKHARGISSLDALSLPPMSSANLRLYKETELIYCDGFPVLMIPYHHDQLQLAHIIRSFADKDPELASRTIAMAHTAVHGAIQNTAWGTTFAGPLGISAFQGLARTFSGHFHSHQTLYQPGEERCGGEGVEMPAMQGSSSKGSLTYVGSPLQFNFGDLGDLNRGVLIYSPATDKFELIPNPDGVRFTQVQLEDVLKAKIGASVHSVLQEKVEGKMVSVAVKSSTGWHNDAASLREFEAAKDILVNMGAKSVRKPFRRSAKQRDMFVPTLSAAAKARIREKEANATIAPYRFSDFVVPFVDQRIARAEEGEKVTASMRKALVEEGMDIVATAEKDNTGSVKTEREGVIFRGDIQRLELENFLGVKDKQVLDLGDYRGGVWYVQGKNGAGKSTILEALTWCLFGQFLRSEMKADFAVNDEVGKNTRVAVTFANGYSIERFRKYTKLGGTGVVVRKDGEPLEGMDKGNRDAAQAGIDHLLGTNFAAYSKTVVLAEETARGFVQATPAARRQIIEDLLGFGEFELYLKELRSRLKSTKQAIAELDLEKHGLLTLASSAKDYSTKLLQRLSDAEARIAACHKEIRRLEVEDPQDHPGREEEVLLMQRDVLRKKQRLSDLAIEWKELKHGLEQEERTIRMDLQQLRGKQESLQQQALTIQEQQETIARMAVGNQQLKKVQAELGKHQRNVPSVLGDLGSKLLEVVPPVGKPLVQPMLSEATRALLEDVEEVDESLRELQTIMEEPFQNKSRLLKKSTLQIKLELVRVGGALVHNESALKQQLKKADSMEADWVAKIGPEDWSAIQAMLSQGIPNQHELRAQIQATAAQRDDLLNRHSGPEDPRISQVKIELARADELKRELASLLESEEQQEAERLQKMAELEGERSLLVEKEVVLSFWDEGFGRKGKSMRDYVFEENLFELNAVLEEVMERLCDDGVDYHDLQTSLSKDFAFSGKDYGKRSSGERKRTALALFFSLVQLTRSRSRHQTEFIMLDECFDALDASGQDSAHRIIVEMHRGLGNSAGVQKAFVITHSQNANVGHLLRVEKNAAGTQFFPEPNNML